MTHREGSAMTSEDKIDVWMLSVYNGKGLYALAFPTVDKLIEYVIDYYGDESEPLTPPADGGDITAWLGNIAAEWGIELAIDHDPMERVK